MRIQAALLFYLLFAGMFAMAQPPDVSKLNEKEKIQARLAYCEALRINQSGAKGNFDTLQQAALKGLSFLQTADAADRSQFYFYLALSYYYQVQFDSAQHYFYQSLSEAQKGHIAKQITKACVALIPVNFQLQQSQKVEECKSILQSIVDTTRDVNLLQDGDYALGSYYQQKSYYGTAQEYFIKSLELREKEVDSTKDNKKKFDYAILCDMLSKLYLNTEMPDKSIGTLRQGERFANVSPNVSNRLLSSFVEAFTTSGNIDSALHFNHVLEVNTKGNPIFPSEIVSSNLNIAIYYIDHKEYSKVLTYLNKADTLAARIQSPLLLFQAQLITGRYYEETGKYDAAIALLNESLPVAKQFSRELYANALKAMAMAQKGKGNSSEAVAYFQQYAEQTDSITKEKLSTNFADEETRYQTTQKEHRIASLDKENQLKLLALQNAAHTKWLLLLGLISVGIIALLLYFIYRNKEKLYKVLNRQHLQLGELNSQLAVANETKAKLFSIIGHDLRSPIGKIVQLMQLQKENPQLLSEQERQKHEAQLQTTSENVLETMEDLLLWSKSQMQRFTPQFSLLKIGETVDKEINLLHQQIEEKGLKISNELQDDFVQNTDENFLSVILRNLLQNAVKYSNSGSMIAISSKGQNLQIINQSAAADAEALNSQMKSERIDSAAYGFGLQIASDLAIAIKAKIYFIQPGKDLLAAVISWDN